MVKAKVYSSWLAVRWGLQATTGFDNLGTPPAGSSAQRAVVADNDEMRCWL